MFKISFNFDEANKTISNLKCEEITQERKIVSNGKPIVEVGENKLIISPEALRLINATAGDRITVNYIQKSKELTIPVIGKSEIFSDSDAGNKLTKSNTVSFKGKQRTILLEYGSVFTLTETHKNGMCQLISTNEDDSPEVTELEIPDMEIEEMTDNFENLDELPF
jgi:hypothetical protein